MVDPIQVTLINHRYSDILRHVEISLAMRHSASQEQERVFPNLQQYVQPFATLLAAANIKIAQGIESGQLYNTTVTLQNVQQ